MSYLDNALNHKPVDTFKSAPLNSTVNFFSSRAKFAVALVEKIVNLVESFFKLIIVETLPAIVNYADGRARAKATGIEIRDSLRDITIAFTGLICCKSAAIALKGRISGETNQALV